MSSTKKDRAKSKADSETTENVGLKGEKHKKVKSDTQKDKNPKIGASEGPSSNSDNQATPSRIIIADSSTFPEWPGSPRTADEIAATAGEAAAATTKPLPTSTDEAARPSVDDYTFGKTLGKGAFGDVCCCKFLFAKR
jgi:hypothetical protein